MPGSKYHDGKRNHLQEGCSATLIANAVAREADTIVTAWHCLANYNDLSKPILFILLPGTPDGLQREAFPLADGGGMYADWALLRLRQPIALTGGVALAIHPGRANPAWDIAMAGYSRDQAKGGGGDRLTFDPACLITKQAALISHSNCLAHKGASGGAVVQLSSTGAPQFSGVVSEGNGAGVSTFVPVTVFRSAINRFLR